jgi:hypothetical protein
MEKDDGADRATGRTYCRLGGEGRPGCDGGRWSVLAGTVCGVLVVLVVSTTLLHWSQVAELRSRVDQLEKECRRTEETTERYVDNAVERVSVLE